MGPGQGRRCREDSFPRDVDHDRRSAVPPFRSSAVPQFRPEANRWSGQNRGGWSNPDYDRLWDAYNNTLGRPEQVRLFAEMMKIRSEDVASIPLHYSLNATAHLSALRGPDVGVSETTSHWNIYDWELT